jgi:putative peptidoglycan lipid II flippase
MSRPLKINDISLGRASMLLALMIGLSRLTGFGRLMVTTYFFGIGPQTDAYIAAFNIPDTLSILISGGLLATGFVPVFTGYLAKGQNDEARITFRALLTLMTVGFGGISLFLFALTFTPFGTILAPDGIGIENTALYLYILRILLFAQFLFVVGGVFSGTFNALRLFWFPALQPVFYNVGIIIGGILGQRGSIASQAWGALGGALIGTVVLLAPAAIRHGLSLKPLWDLKDEGVRRVMASLMPIFLGLASGQIIALNLPRAFAKVLPVGATSSLDYANRLMQVPLDVLASSAAVALLPTIARLWVEEKPDELRATFEKSLRRNLGLMFFATAMTLALAPSIIHLLLERGKFDARNASDTALVLRCYAFCLPALGAQQLLARGFYATGKNTKPVGIGLIAMALFLILGALAVKLPVPGAAALAIAAAISTSVLSLLLWRELRKLLGRFEGPGFWAGVLKSGAVAALGGGVAWGVASGLSVALKSYDTELTLSLLKIGVRILIVVGGAGAGGAVWLAASKALGLANFKRSN